MGSQTQNKTRSIFGFAALAFALIGLSAAEEKSILTGLNELVLNGYTTTNAYLTDLNFSSRVSTSLPAL